jgi:hypothetical protein
MASSANSSLDFDAQQASAQLPWQIACEALDTGKCLQISLKDSVRIFEVHRVGINAQGDHILSGWQIRGPTYERVGWKLINLEGTLDLALTGISSLAPRPDYRRGAKQFIRIICQL